jgi:TRAP transporter TAXI family solute receptor
MVGSSSGGTAHLYFAAASAILNKYIPGMESTAASGGTTENIPRLERGEIQVCCVNPGAGMKLYGKDWLQKTRIRTIFNMFHTPYHVIVPKDSPIKQFSDLKGKRVSVGTRGGGEAYLFQRIREVVGLKESDVKMEFLGKGEAINAYKDGAVDAIAYMSPLPNPGVMELGSHRRGARVVGLAPQEIKKLISLYPEYSEYTIEKKWYDNAIKDGSDVLSFTEWYYIASRDDFSADTAYQMARVLDERHDELVAAFKAAHSSTAAATAKDPGFQLHPGAAKYLKEKGLIK